MQSKKLLFQSFLIFSFVSLLHAQNGTPQAPVANTPIPGGRAQMKPTVEATPNGAKIKASFHMADLDSVVSLSLLAPITEPNGNKMMIELARIDDKFVHSSTDYHTERTYDLDYAKVNAMLKQKAPQANLEIGPGTNLFVYARWMNLSHLDMYTDVPVPGLPVVPPNGENNHQWGGISRDGGIILPGGKSSSASVGFTKGGITTALDVSNVADQTLQSKFPQSLYAGYSTAGSRFENELKLAVDPSDIPRISQYFNSMEQNPALLEQTFGKGWTLVANRKYVGQPMIDDYMDNDKHEAASIGMALRYRTGNNITSLNYKPNDGKYASGAVYERIEYDLRNFVDTGMKGFADSYEPMNPLQLIRDHIPGSTPSDFFQKRVRLTDERLKFELTAPTGDKVEISVDHVKARKLDKYGSEVGPTAEYGQLEVEVDHLGANGSTNRVNSTNTLSEYMTKHGPALDTYLKNLPEGSVVAASLPPTFHGEEDFHPNSPIKTTNAANFKLAFDVFDKIRTGVFGANWHSSGQKYAVAAAGLGLVPPEKFAPSVNRMLEEKEKRINLSSPDKLKCLATLVKISGLPTPPAPNP